MVTFINCECHLVTYFLEEKIQTNATGKLRAPVEDTLSADRVMRWTGGGLRAEGVCTCEADRTGRVPRLRSHFICCPTSDRLLDQHLV